MKQVASAIGKGTRYSSSSLVSSYHLSDRLSSSSSNMDDLLSAFAGLGTSSNEELVAKFAQIMQTDTNTATFFLEASNWNVELALNSYLSSMGGSSIMQQQLAMTQPPKGACQVVDPSGALQAQLLPNQPFQLIWNITNNGTSAWPRNVTLLHTEGPTLGGPKTAQMGGGVQPGKMLSQSLQLQAPSSPGQFASTWRLKYDGGYFGDSIWIITNVVAPPGGGASPYAAAQAAMNGTATGATPNVGASMEQMMMGMMGQVSSGGAFAGGGPSGNGTPAASLNSGMGMMNLSMSQQSGGDGGGEGDDDMMDDDL